MTKRKLPLSRFLSLPSTSRLFWGLLFLVPLVLPLTAPSKAQRLLLLASPLGAVTEEEMRAFRCLPPPRILLGFRSGFTFLRFTARASWTPAAVGNSLRLLFRCLRLAPPPFPALPSSLPGPSRLEHLLQTRGSDNTLLNYLLFGLFHLVTCTQVPARLHMASGVPVSSLHL